ncbi:hypothetical protein P280DRAFT_514930 [Massarina eburnea CBS 473.64]|uniref:Piwi domain-containing protein n=1 Tax=Massarina eburnea CBS 473.64 TaxID=1395130 RepID=A0A6A6SB14_9PLEO|nr:hypothetical protein P280DRAFT_514930 [Massarina eburnea CBS 473.64]
MRLQPKDSVEVIQDVESMVVERIADWRKANNATWPKNILYYRDGVSEGQYVQVKDLELRQIGKAVAQAAKNAGLKVVPKVKLTAVVVAKRHHVRFFPKHGEAMKGNGNCQPGTLVDRVITSPFYQDFYLQSHNGLKGTAKPAHYFVLVNEMGLGETVLQSFTHNLCYTYVRATLGVSYAPPAYYADRLCERGRCYLRRFFVADAKLRSDLEDLKFVLQLEYREKRKVEFGGKGQGGGESGKGGKGMNKKEIEREVEHKKAILETLKKDTLMKARVEFYRWKGGVEEGNPWAERLGETMFWM